MKQILKRVVVTSVAGLMLFCSACATSETECEHVYGEWTVVNAATCIADGLERRTCTNKGCDAYEEQAITKTGHKFSTWSVVSAVTCTEDGVERRDCTNGVCEEYEERVLPYTGHNFGEWTVEKDSTCKEEGVERRECVTEGCDEYETRSKVKSGHDFQNGICSVCSVTEDGYIFTSGQVKADVNCSGQGASDWSVDATNGTYTSVTAANAMLTFKDWQFNGGVIEWDMMVPSDQYTHMTTIGIMFGADVENATTGGANDTYYVMGRAFTSEFVGYSKNQGALLWEDVAKISPPSITCNAGETYRYRIEWDNVNNIITLTFADQVVSFNPSNVLTGGYFGLYSEVAGTVFSNIVVTPKTYENTGGVSICNWSTWQFGKDENGITYTCTSSVGLLMFDNLKFTTGTIEWDMTVPNDTYHFGTLCGVIWGSATNKADFNSSLYYCSGRYAGGIFVTYVKYSDGNGGAAFEWENADQIMNGELMPAAVKVSYKLQFDGTTFTLSIGNVAASVVPVHKLSGEYFGLYSEVAGTTFSNIRVTVAE